MNATKQLPIYFVARILPAIVTFFSISLYTHLLDPSSFGVYALLLSVALTVGLTGFSWLRVAALRMLASVNVDEEPNFMATTAVSFLGTSVCVALSILVILRFYNDRLSASLVWLTILCAISSSWFELNVTVAQARGRLGAVASLQIGRSFIAFGSTLLFIHIGLKKVALLAGYVGGNLSSLGAISLWCASVRGKYERTIVRNLFNFGWPGSAAGIGGISTTYLRYWVERVASTAAVGVYSAAADFASQTIGLLMGTSSLAGQPLAFRARDHGTYEELMAQLRTNATILLVVGVGAMAGMIALAEPISRLYIGSKFHAAVGTHVDQIIMLSSFSVCLACFRGYYFEQAFEIVFKTWPLVFITVFRTTMTVVAGFILVRSYGILGAVASGLLAEFSSTVVSAIWGRCYVAMPFPVVNFLKISLAAAVMAVAIMFVPGRDSIFGLAVAVAVGLVTYAALLFLLFRAELSNEVMPLLSRRKISVGQ